VDLARLEAVVVAFFEGHDRFRARSSAWRLGSRQIGAMVVGCGHPELLMGRTKRVTICRVQPRFAPSKVCFGLAR